MSRDTSFMLKGIAILMMVFLHLFNRVDVVITQTTPLLYIGSIPFVNILTRACPPVPFFLILSGYGLDYMYAQGRVSFKNQLHRLLKLYITYWLVLFIFVSIGSILRPNVYPGDLYKIIGNITSYNSSYNAVSWFLFPYMLLSLTSIIIFRILDKVNKYFAIILFCFIYLISAYIYSRYIAVKQSYDSVFAHVVVYFESMFSFVIGALLHRQNIKGKLFIRSLKDKNILLIVCLLVLVSLKCFIRTMAFDPFYSFVFIFLFIHLNVKGVFRSFLYFMGKYSMVIWLTHSFFCIHLFPKFIYSFKLPLLIYAALLLVSISVSFPIMKLSQSVAKKLRL